MGELKAIPTRKSPEPEVCPFCEGEHSFFLCDRVRRLEFSEDYTPAFDSIVSVEFWPPDDIIVDIDPDILDDGEQGGS